MATSLTELERVLATFNDGIDQLESEQAIDPRQTIEDAVGNFRYGRDRLARIIADHIRALEDFARDHPVAEPYDPDDDMERE